VFTLGESNDLFHPQVQQALNAWIDGLTQVLTEAELDSEQARKRAEDANDADSRSASPTRALGDTTLFERSCSSCRSSLWMLFASTGDVVDLWLIAFNGANAQRVEYSKLCYRKRGYLRSQV